MSSTVVMTIDKNWSGKVSKGMEAGLAEMATDIHKKSSMLAPKASSALVNSGMIKKTADFEYTISYGSSKVPYARRRHYENKKNPQTIRYLEKAGESVKRGNQEKYWRNKI